MILKIRKILIIVNFYPLINITKKISILIMDYSKKYLKYKSKYLKLKSTSIQTGGASNSEKKEIYFNR